MAELTSEQQLFLIRELASFTGPSVAAALFKDEYGLKITRQAVQHYNAPRSPKLDAELAAAFWKIREDVLSGATKIGIANKTARLRRLERLADQAEEQGALSLCADITKQAAQEVGEVFTNKRQVTINPQQALAELLGCSPEELPTPPT